MTGLYQDGFVRELQMGLAEILSEWGIAEGATTELLNLSENATFLVTASTGARFVFRVHRPGYHSLAEIGSELTWILALRADQTVETPAILSRLDGQQIGEFDHHGERRYVVGFAFMEGKEPDPESDLRDGFRELGAISARLHAHVRTWSPPNGFVRKTWDWDAAFGVAPLWGDWRNALGLDADGKRLLHRLADELRSRTDSYGKGPDRFGLIHADLRLANLLVKGPRLGIIDFDDCGFSWLVYDFAAAISFIETSPDIPDLLDAWVEGYRAKGALDAQHVAMIPTFVLFRRLLLTAWIASHSETETAAWAGHAAFTDGTLYLAERYLTDDRTMFGRVP